MKRRFLISAAVAFVLFIALIPQTAALTAPTYQITDLGVLFQGMAISADGDVAGILTVGSQQHAAIWSNGSFTDLGTLPTGFNSQAFAINARGQVAGMASILQGNNALGRAFLYSNGVLVDLGTFGGTQSTAWGINARGQIVGAAQTTNSNHAFLYSNGTLTDLGTLDGSNGESTAFAINNSGDIVGISRANLANGEHAFLYRNGKMVDLGTLGGETSTAHGINARGEVVGWSQTQGGLQHPFFFFNGQLKDLMPNSTREGIAVAINNRGEIVGSFNQDDGTSTAAIFDANNTTVVDLNTLVSSDAFLEDARAINDAGQIILNGCWGNVCHTFILTPVRGR